MEMKKMMAKRGRKTGESVVGGSNGEVEKKIEIEGGQSQRRDDTKLAIERLRDGTKGTGLRRHHTSNLYIYNIHGVVPGMPEQRVRQDEDRKEQDHTKNPQPGRGMTAAGNKSDERVRAGLSTKILPLDEEDFIEKVSLQPRLAANGRTMNRRETGTRTKVRQTRTKVSVDVAAEPCQRACQSTHALKWPVYMYVYVRRC